ncbi:hypothetical protein [Curtobacterium sp. Leaf261]|uniref:hypothetical protein n=1 Tax=Curtobacterium sp. Leaf261 TaxID=1736311 RepID=UPI0006F574A4|nr:hypothetical protein [Curtobacterium sp. Leaf261]KQO60256.1 hypothetical protein ASF23_14935 [Curtobacterium sp. Leaf261]
MQHITPRHARLATWIAVPLAVVASGLVVAGASYSAFSATTENAENAWRTGAVALTDDDAGTAMFDVAGVVPGQTGSNCITVTSTSSVESAVKLYASDTTSTKSLGDHVQLEIEHGSGGAFGSCDGFVAAGAPIWSGSLSAFAATATDFATGVGSWTPATGEEATTYRVSYTLDAAAPNTVQDASATSTFTWESQND